MTGAAPRLLLCAPGSGSGKTTVTCALLQALVNRGARPAAFKCGPDYLDPMFHSEIIGAKSGNLDLFFFDENTVRALLLEGSAGCGLSVIEGAMGYYDGVGLSEAASAYALASCTASPAVLVADGRGSALSLAALVKGFLDFRPRSGIGGVVLNRVSPMRYPGLKAAVEGETGLRVYGFLPERPDCTLESRHLGLVAAAEAAGLKEKLQKLAAQAEETLDLDGLLALARSAPALTAESVPLPEPAAGRPRIAVARDEAFSFYYADGLRLLEELGAELAEFSPLRDGALPERCSGLYLGGGYPELHGKALSENASLRVQIREAVLGGLPTVAECGGFLYLHESLEGADGGTYPMAGVFPAHAFAAGKLSRFGYVNLTAAEDNLLCGAGEALPAHEFHYWDSTAPGGAFRARKPRSDRGWACGHVSPSLYAGFPHFHFRAVPRAAARFVRACAAYSQSSLKQ